MSMKHGGSYLSTYVLLNLLNELRNRDKMRGLLDSIYHVTLQLF